MRMSGKGKSAYDVVNSYAESELRRILRDYGDEKFASKIAFNIVKAREEKPIKTTLELAEIIKGSIPMKAREKGHHPAKKSFQAIRIEVNDELAIIDTAVSDAVSALKEGGRLAIISFHSLEDKAVKHAMAQNAKGCECPPSFPVCVCGKKPKIKILTKNAVTSTDEELENNPRARSAKLRVAEKI
jgi:16S rRNA (cytosine1402-N4)-methyltransferase